MKNVTEIGGHPADESVWRRAWRDAARFRETGLFRWWELCWGVVSAVVFSQWQPAWLLALTFSGLKEGASAALVVGCGFLLGIVAGALARFMYALGSAPIRQRTEARREVARLSRLMGTDPAAALQRFRVAMESLVDRGAALPQDLDRATFLKWLHSVEAEIDRSVTLGAARRARVTLTTLFDTAVIGSMNGRQYFGIYREHCVNWADGIRASAESKDMRVGALLDEPAWRHHPWPQPIFIADAASSSPPGPADTFVEVRRSGPSWERPTPAELGDAGQPP